MKEMCACGKPLHYNNAELERIIRAMIRKLGPDIKITAGGRPWIVPRHYLALHGIKAVELSTLGFPEVTHQPN